MVVSNPNLNGNVSLRPIIERMKWFYPLMIDLTSTPQ